MQLNLGWDILKKHRFFQNIQYILQSLFCQVIHECESIMQQMKTEGL